jgi:hypothetical protein
VGSGGRHLCPPLPSRRLRSRTAAAYGRTVPTTVSVFSNTQVSPEQVAWLLNQFDALQGPSGQSWIIDVGPDATDVVGVADGTDGLASMPPELSDRERESVLRRPAEPLRCRVDRLTCVRGDLAWRIGKVARW